MEHLNEQQINQILNGAVKGIEMKNALLHVETCAICQAKMPNLEKSDLLGIILNEPVFLEEPTPEITQTSKPTFWNLQSAFLKVGFAGILLLIFGGFVFWFFNNKKENEVAKNPVNSTTPTPLVNSNNPINSNGNIVLPDNSNQNQNVQIVPKNTNLSNRIQNVASPTPTLKPTPSETPKVQDVNSPEPTELAVNLGKYPKPLVGLESPNVEIRGNQNTKKKFFVKYPIGEVISETQPTLRWNSVENSDSYVVTVYDENYNEVYSKEVSGTSLKIEKSLKRGEKYQWQVKAKIKDTENPTITSSPSIFRIAKAETIDKVNKNSVVWKKIENYYKEGLLTDAEKLLNDILRKNPKDKLAIKYLRQIKSVRNKTQKPPTDTKPAQ